MLIALLINISAFFIGVLIAKIATSRRNISIKQKSKNGNNVIT